MSSHSQRTEYKRVVTQASEEMLARWILKNLDWSGGNDDGNGAFLTAILLEHRRQAAQQSGPSGAWRCPTCSATCIPHQAKPEAGADEGYLRAKYKWAQYGYELYDKGNGHIGVKRIGYDQTHSNATPERQG